MSLFSSLILVSSLFHLGAAARPGVSEARLTPSSSTSIAPSKAVATSTISVASFTPTAIAASLSTSTGSGKRGLCYNNPAMTKFFGGSGSKVTWMYDWSETPLNGPNSAFKYIPMLWSNSADQVTAWNANAKAGIAGGADALLGYLTPSIDLKHQY